MSKLRDCPAFASFGRDVKAARKKLGFTRSELAELVHIDPRYLANIENVGDIPSVPVLYDLLQVCHLPAEKYFHSVIAEKMSEKRQVVRHKLMLCPEKYLTVIEGALDGALQSEDTPSGEGTVSSDVRKS